MRAPMPSSGKSMVTLRPFMASAAAISAPINPPPITAKSAPVSLSSARR